MGLWIESLPQLKSLGDLLSGQAELVVAVSVFDYATPTQKKQVSDDAVRLSSMVRNQLELYDLGAKEKGKEHRG